MSEQGAQLSDFGEGQLIHALSVARILKYLRIG